MDAKFFNQLRAARKKVNEANERLTFFYAVAEVFEYLSSSWKANPDWGKIVFQPGRSILLHPEVISLVTGLAQRHGFNVSFDDKDFTYSMTLMK